MDDLDELMNMDPLNLTDLDITYIVNYQRETRLRAESGAKPTKTKTTVKLDSVMKALVPKPQIPKLRRI